MKLFLITRTFKRLVHVTVMRYVFLEVGI